MRYWSLVVLALALALSGCKDGFSEADIKDVQNEIEKTYGSKDKIKAVKASLIKESRRKLTGFVTLEGTDSSKATISCAATMDESERNYIWQCGK